MLLIIFSLSIGYLLTSAPVLAQQSGFKEIVIDSAGPNKIWMKTTGDINNDGKTDMIVGGWESGGIVAYLAPHWTKQVIADTLHVSTDAAIADMNNDGKNDIVAVVKGAVVILFAPDWRMQVIDSLEGHDVEVADFDGDGLKDILCRNQGEWGYHGDTAFFYKQTPTGQFEESHVIIPDGEGLLTADINKDGKVDFVVQGTWFENTGNIKNWIPHVYSKTWIWKSSYIAYGDVDGDGREDILLSPSEKEKGSYHISWFEAPVDPYSIWKEHIIESPVESVVHFIGCADFNLDGKLDIMTARMQQGADPDEVAVYYQKKKGKFNKQIISTGGSHSIQLFDCDGDGDMDAFGANFNESIVKLWINQAK